MLRILLYGSLVKEFHLIHRTPVVVSLCKSINLRLTTYLFSSSTGQPVPSLPPARTGLHRDRHGKIARQDRQEDQPEARARPRQARPAASTVQLPASQRHDRRAEQWIRRLQIQS